MPVVSCETYDVEGYAIDDMNQYEGFEGVETIQSAAVLNREENELTVFVINADGQDSQELSLDIRGFENWQCAGHTVLYSKDPEARNSYEQPDVLVPRENAGVRFEKGICTAVLPALSWNVFRFTVI